MGEARELVEAELERQGWGAGEEPIWRGLQQCIPRARVRRVLHELKAERRRRRARHTREARVHVTVLARDVMWAMDATHLGRLPSGEAVQAEVIRDVAPGRTIGLSVGPAACAGDVICLLNDTMGRRDGAPLVLVTDNGPAYRSKELDRWCRDRSVAHLFSLPRTPQHNAWAEHGIGELKRDAQLERIVIDVGAVYERLERSRERLDGCRLHRTRGWKTAAEADASTPSWRSLVSREALYGAVTCAVREAVLDYSGSRARRRAVREAILGTLERFSVIQRTRGARS